MNNTEKIVLKSIAKSLATSTVKGDLRNWVTYAKHMRSTIDANALILMDLVEQDSEEEKDLSANNHLISDIDHSYLT